MTKLDFLPKSLYLPEPELSVAASDVRRTWGQAFIYM